MFFLNSKPQLTYFLNDFDTDDRAWIPEVWAQETLMITESLMVMGRLVHTNFKDEVQDFGDTVNTRLPGKFTAERKGVNDDVTIQDATATKVAVTLDQHFHTSFLIRDGQESMSFNDLVKEYLRPAALSLAEAIDKVLTGQVYQFLDNAVGVLGTFSSSDALTKVLDVREKMNVNLCPMQERNLVLAPGTETAFLSTDTFTEANKVGDDGEALREASLGRKLGFDIYMSQNTPSPSIVAGTGNANELASGAVVGDTALTLDGAELDNGQYFWLESDGQPLRCLSGGGTTSVVSHRALKADVAVGSSDLFEITEGAVDLAGDSAYTSYPAGHVGRIKVDGTGVPHLGQIVAFATDSPVYIAGEYRIINIPASGYIVLDRPLDLAIANDYIVNYGPRGDYNFAFHRDALALIVRPLAVPKSGTGALSGVASYNDLSVRVTITYDGVKQGHLVTLDILAGVKVLNTDLGAVLLAGNYTESYA